AGAEDVFRFVQLAFYLSMHRVPGFGGAEMVGYLGKDVSFESWIARGFSVSATGTILSLTRFLRFDQSQEINGVILDGVRKSFTGASAKGERGGSIAFTIRSGPDPC